MICIGIFIIPMQSFSQEDVASSEAMLVEQQDINFQTFFFESLQQKAIENYDKAIYALEACKNIDQKSVAVFFELSKNYVFLLKYTEAEFYILKGLELEPNNIHMLRHLKEIKTNQNDYTGAVKIQYQIIKIKPEEEADLVILYIKSGEIDKAIVVLKKLDKLNKLPKHLVALKQSLLQISIPSEKNISPKPNFRQQPKSKTELLKEQYNLKRDYSSLKVLLERELIAKQYLELHNDSKEAIDLYPMQPYVYLMHGISLNSLRKYQEAIFILESGLEYLIDNDGQKAQFMEQLSLSYKGLGDNKTASSYYKKSLDLQKKD